MEKAIVVGGTSGIGAAIARRLVADGARVIVLGRRASGPDAIAHDVEDTDEIPALWERCIAMLGGVDTLVYASGVMPAIVESEYSFEKDRSMMLVNVVGAMAWMNLAAARFEAARAGTIVGISSIAGERGRRGNPAYCTSKAALTTYLEALRNRCARYGVNVVTIKPGFVDTPMTAGMQSLLWLVSADVAAEKSLALVRKGNSASGFVPRRWWLVALIVRMLPSFVFRKLNI